MDSVKAGKPLVDLTKLCYAADQPVLVSGHRGVGKSEVLEQAAEEMKIGYITRDLSLMESPDLTGLPRAKGGTTIYLPPSFLPKRGKGLLVFEELNRCPRYMRAPCLQLLTARTLNDYRLPDGWLPVATINPPDAGYEVAELDPALLSRFAQVRVIPDRMLWLEWAKRNGVHHDVIRYVENDSSMFDDADSNPRAWTYVSDLLQAAERHGASQEAVRAVVLGLVGDTRGVAFLQARKQRERPLTADEILTGYTKRRGEVQRWISNHRIDLAKTSLHDLLTSLQPKAEYEVVRGTNSQWSNLSRFLADLPGDLADSAREFFKERNYVYPTRKSKR